MNQETTPSTDKHIKKHPLFYIAVTTVMCTLVIVGAYYFSLFVVWDYNPHFLQAEACLDNAGVWDDAYQEQGRCWYAGQCEDMDGYWFPAENRCVFDSIITTGDVL